ncbi:hypothetical protein V7S43_000176 [Phytophthora oleae]|uniref:Uncharacterized protein n=1 Tax=Phytophthora oleae TaxID=2107226 RepID=A0ABD3G4Z0_9STRA
MADALAPKKVATSTWLLVVCVERTEVDDAVKYRIAPVVPRVEASATSTAAEGVANVKDAGPAPRKEVSASHTAEGIGAKSLDVPAVQ